MFTLDDSYKIFNDFLKIEEFTNDGIKRTNRRITENDDLVEPLDTVKIKETVKDTVCFTLKEIVNNIDGKVDLLKNH